MRRNGTREYDGFATVTVSEARAILGAIATFWTCWSAMAWGFRTGDEFYLLAIVPAFTAFGVLAWTCARVGARATGGDPVGLFFSDQSFGREVASLQGMRQLARCAEWPGVVVWAMYGVLGTGMLVFASLFLFPPPGE